MDSLLNEVKVFDNVFKYLKQMQIYIQDMKKLEFHNLPKPICLHNAYILNKHYLKETWLDEFPTLENIEKKLKSDKLLCLVPDEEYYYLYYHFLIALRQFQELDGLQIFDDVTSLDYYQISIYLDRNDMSAFDFFMKYFMYGLNVDNENAVFLNNSKSIDYVSDDDNPDNKMSSEPTAPTLELEPQIEISKKLSPLSFEAEPTLENIDSPKKVKQNEIF